MRLFVLALTHDRGVWAAKQAQASILASMGYLLSRHQVRVFCPTNVEGMRGISLRDGDHVWYADQWDSSAKLKEAWWPVVATAPLDQTVWINRCSEESLHV